MTSLAKAMRAAALVLWLPATLMLVGVLGCQTAETTTYNQQQTLPFGIAIDGHAAMYMPEKAAKFKSVNGPVGYISTPVACDAPLTITLPAGGPAVRAVQGEAFEIDANNQISSKVQELIIDPNGPSPLRGLAGERPCVVTVFVYFADGTNQKASVRFDTQPGSPAAAKVPAPAKLADPANPR